MQRFDILTKLGTVFDKLAVADAGTAGEQHTTTKLDLLKQVKSKQKDLDVLKERIGKEIANQSSFEE